MKNKILSLAIAAIISLSAVHAFAANSTDKPVSKVSDVQNMSDDTMVYIQGYITQNLGDEKYIFQDSSGTMTVEIDDDLMQNNITPTTMVWIAAEVDKKGNIVELDAEEIQLMPEAAEGASMSSGQ